MPVAGRHQQQTVKDAGKKDHAKGFVQLSEPVIRNASDQGDHHQREQEVTGPFTDDLGSLDPHLRIAAGSARTAAAGNQARLDQRLGQPFQLPVKQYQQAGADADIAVQLVKLVEAIEALFQPPGAAGQYDPGAHPPQGKQAGKEDQWAAPSPQISG